MGVMCATGSGMVKNPAEAVKWFRKAAGNNNVKAQYYLGIAYSHGSGVEKSETEAIKWFQKAAEQGHPTAQYSLGSMYASGRGVQKDLGQAAGWYRKSAEQGRAAAQFMGAVPEGQVRAFFDKLLPSASELALARAEAHYAAGSMDEAEKDLGEVQPDSDTDARVAALRQGIAFARAGRDGLGEPELKARIDKTIDFIRSIKPAQLDGTEDREALEELLEIVRRAKTWKDGEARKQMVAIFNLAAADPDLVSEFRRKLSSALY